MKTRKKLGTEKARQLGGGKGASLRAGDIDNYRAWKEKVLPHLLYMSPLENRRTQVHGGRGRNRRQSPNCSLSLPRGRGFSLRLLLLLVYQTTEGCRHPSEAPPPTTKRACGPRIRLSRSGLGGIIAGVDLPHKLNELIRRRTHDMQKLTFFSRKIEKSKTEEEELTRRKMAGVSLQEV
ncbi:UNVERIFIED_CONTAM: hypothetical protein Sradi_1539000 [Sesamum radiatum]|uniref:Uncharacterized protein n=1 Tax=Sesamum radiatum TaxID=300843 RepID=A0AAW2U9Y1_SESRA